MSRIDFLGPQHAHGPAEAPSREGVAKLRAHAVGCIGQHGVEAHAGSAHAIEFGQRQVGLAVKAHGGRHPGAAAAGAIIGPLPREIEPERLLARHAHRVATLLRERGVIDDEHRLGTTDQALSRAGQLLLERGRRPGRGGDKVVQLLDIIRRHARGHRGHALALAGAQQAMQIHRRPAALGLAPEGGEKRAEPAGKLTLPIPARPTRTGH